VNWANRTHQTPDARAGGGLDGQGDRAPLDDPGRGRPGTRCPEEDTADGFQHGGWHLRYFDDTSRKWPVDSYAAAGGFVFGRRILESLAGYWPHASEEEQVIAEPLNSRPKYVASTTLIEPLAWQHSTVLKGDVAEAVAALKGQDGGDLRVVGSMQLVQMLIAHRLVDELQLMVDPLMVGGGKGIFPADGMLRPLRLVDSKVTSTGAILATYAPANA
jgi:dihydrofolate reductase